MARTCSGSPAGPRVHSRRNHATTSFCTLKSAAHLYTYLVAPPPDLQKSRFVARRAGFLARGSRAREVNERTKDPAHRAAAGDDSVHRRQQHHPHGLFPEGRRYSQDGRQPGGDWDVLRKVRPDTHGRVSVNVHSLITCTTNKKVFVFINRGEKTRQKKKTKKNHKTCCCFNSRVGYDMCTRAEGQTSEDDFERAASCVERTPPDTRLCWAPTSAASSASTATEPSGCVTAR